MAPPSSFIASDELVPARIFGGLSLPEAPNAANLLAWWSAGHGQVVNGSGRVTAWRAAQGIGTPPTLTAPAGGPTYSASGPVFANTVAERLEASAGLPAWTTGAIVVARFRLAALAPTPNHGLGLVIDPAGSYVYAHVNAAGNFSAESRAQGGTVRSSAIGPAPITTWSVVAAYGGGFGGGSHERRVESWNGTAHQANYSATTTPTNFQFPAAAFQLGAAGGLSAPCCPMNGTISDVMLYRAPGAAPTDAALQVLTNFLRDLPR